MINTTIHLCNHCTNNLHNFCQIYEVDVSNYPTELEFLTLQCANFIQRTYPYCPYCGTPFTLVNEVVDPDSEASYLDENFRSDIMTDTSELPWDRYRVFILLDKDIEKKRLEYEEALSKKAYFEEHFNHCFGDIKW